MWGEAPQELQLVQSGLLLRTVWECRCLNQSLLKTVLEGVVKNHSTVDLEKVYALGAVRSRMLSAISRNTLNARPPNGAFLENERVLRVSLGEWLGVFGV